MMARSQPSCLASARAHHAADVGRNDHQVLVVLLVQVAQQHRRGVDVVHRNVEETLDLVGVQVHGQHPGHATACSMLATTLAGWARAWSADGDPGGHSQNRGITAVMRSAEARLSASTMISSSIRFSLVGAQVDWTTKRRGRARSADLDRHLTIGEAADIGGAQGGAQVLRDFGAKPGLALPVNTTKILGVGLHEWVTLSSLNECPARPQSGFGRGGRIRTLACRNQNPVP